MKLKYETIIVIPFFNEENRIAFDKYKSFIQNHPNVALVLVNDGSRDNTLLSLQKIELYNNKNVKIISYTQNQGKANAVKLGFNYAEKHFYYTSIAYLDADLSTSLQECFQISKQLNQNVIFAFGSRILKLDSTINRKSYRFLIGRIIATMISRQLKLNVYDTQCGCKVFSKDLASEIFKEKFISKWLFDVEIFHRLIALYGLNQVKYIGKEIPLNSWVDVDDSKVHFSYFFKLWFDLYSIGKAYKIIRQPKIN